MTELNRITIHYWMTKEWTCELAFAFTCERVVVSPMNKSMIPWMAWGNVYCIGTIKIHTHTHRWSIEMFRSRWSFVRILYFKSGIKCVLQMACAFHNTNGTTKTTKEYIWFRQYKHFPVRTFLLWIDARCTLSRDGGERDHRSGENNTVHMAFDESKGELARNWKTKSLKSVSCSFNSTGRKREKTSLNANVSAFLLQMRSVFTLLAAHLIAAC